MVKKTKKNGELSDNWQKLIVDLKVLGKSYFMSLGFERKQTLTLIFRDTLAKYCFVILKTCFVKQH